VRGRTVRTPERVAEAQRLRAEGLTWREVGARLGVSLKTAHEWATDPDGAIRDARKASYQGVCEECGGPTNGGDGPGSAPPLCRACLVVWSPEAVIAAIRDWADEHGGVPPTQICWNVAHSAATEAQKREYATGRWPCHDTVRRTFGSWNGGLIAAGFRPHRLRYRDPRVLDEWLAAVAAGESVASIAERYDVTPAAIYMRFRTWGMTRGSTRC
jgi:hypothetical protein